MFTQMQDFVAERTTAVADQVQKFMKEPVAAAREAAVDSAGNLRSLKAPVRVFARSGIKLTVLSQETAQSLIELQSEIIQSAIGDAALRLERASRAANLVDLWRAQVELMPATRERMMEDGRRALTILKHARKELGDVASYAYERVIEPAEEEVVQKARTVKRRAKKVVRKAKATARKTAPAAA